MELDEYRKEAESVLKCFALKRDDIFYFEETPQESKFQDFFSLGKGAIRIAKMYGVERCHFVFKNDISINARAESVNSEGLILINSGLLVWLIQNFFEQDILHEELSVEYSYVISSFDIKVNHLMYQFNLQFAFYHELAHIIQKSELMKVGLNERADESKEFSYERHKLEIDADSFSSLSLSAHILQYAKKSFGDEIDADKVEALIALLVSSFMIYFLSLDNESRVYYYEKTHPHPYVRVMNIITIIVGYLKKAFLGEGVSMELDSTRIARSIIDISKIVEKVVLGQNSNKIVEIQSNSDVERSNLISYFLKIRDVKIKNGKLAVDVWNGTLE